VELLNEIEDEKLLDSELRLFKPVMLYFLFTGRNAWHSTWSERFTKHHAIFPSLRQAKLQAERERAKGTSFGIEQTPGLAFFSRVGTVCIAEFQSSPTFEKLDFSRDNLDLKIGSKISEVIKPFLKPGEEFWKKPFPHLNSFIVAKAEPHERFEVIEHSLKLRKWHSSSFGGNYFLGWHEREFSKLDPVFKLDILFRGQNMEHELAASEAELAIYAEKSLKLNIAKENLNRALSDFNESAVDNQDEE
jgi:hypothetical protein